MRPFQENKPSKNELFSEERIPGLGGFKSWNYMRVIEKGAVQSDRAFFLPSNEQTSIESKFQLSCEIQRESYDQANNRIR